MTPASVKCMCTRRVKSGRCVKSMNPKNTKKSPIHENADANITCDFGDGDIRRLGVAYQTHVYIQRSLAGLYSINRNVLFVKSNMMHMLPTVHIIE